MGRPAVSEQIDPSELEWVTGLLDSGFTVPEIAEKFDTEPHVVYRFLTSMNVDIKKHGMHKSMKVGEFKSYNKDDIAEPLILTYRRRPKYILVPYEEYKEKLL